jgi:hypothetical protein
MAKKKVTKQKQKQTQKQSVIVNIGTKKSSRASSKKPRSAPPSGPVPITYQYLPRTVYYGDAATPVTSTPLVSFGVKPITREISTNTPLPPQIPPPRYMTSQVQMETPIREMPKRDYSEYQQQEPIKMDDVGAFRMPFKFPEVGSGYDAENETGYLTEVSARPIRSKRPNRPKEVIAEEKRKKAERAQIRKLEKEARLKSQG